MNWKLNENSLFAILLRSPWWVSIAIGGVLSAIAIGLLPGPYRGVGAITGLPFFVIGGIAARKQWRAPSRSRIEETLTAVRAMSWPEFSRAIEAAYQRQGYRVSALNGGAANFEITKDGRTALVNCKRWKVARIGIELLSELHASKEAHNAHECIFVAAGEVSDNARAYAIKHRIGIVGGPELARLLPGTRATRSKQTLSEGRGWKAR
jgi:restriction system protein